MTSHARRSSFGFLSVLALGVGFAACVAGGDSPPAEARWPQRTVRIVASAAAGGGGDVVVRTVAEALTIKWARPVIVDNRPGADGILAVRAALDSRDGHTLLFSGSSIVTVNPSMIAALPYDAERDLEPLVQAVEDFITIVSAPSLRVSTLSEILAEARRQSRAFSFTTVPGAPYLTALALQRRAGVELSFVGYRNPLASTTDLTAGRLHLALLPLGSVLGQIQSGNLTPLAVMNTRRSPVMPHVPTIAETGFPELTFDGLLGFFAPATLPSDGRTRVREDVAAVLTAPEIRARLSTIGYAVHPRDAVEYRAILDDLRRHWVDVARTERIQPR